MALQTQSKPANFQFKDPDNVMARMDRDFAQMCSVMEGNGSANPYAYNIIQFYAKIDYLQKEVKRLKDK